MIKELSEESILSHYRIVSKVGAGGMGDVYLAQDTKLDRKAALKILPIDFASNRDRMERFIREAQNAGAPIRKRSDRAKLVAGLVDTKPAEGML
jgi:serine/threonine protein kinase